MKYKLFPLLLLGISVAFPGSGHSQTKSANKHATTKTNSSTATSKQKNAKQAKTAKTKSNSKIRPTESTKQATRSSTHKDSKASAKKQVADGKSKTTKHATQNRASKAKSGNKNRFASSSKSSSNKQNIAANKQKNKTTITRAKTKKQSMSAGRRHSIIASQASSSHKKPLITTLDNLQLDIAESDYLHEASNNNQSRPILIDQPKTTSIGTAHVSIETSLFLDGLEAGLSKELILQLTEIFAWDIDFATNLRPGDQFTLVYGKKLIDGKEGATEEIIAAEFINQGVTHTAVRYAGASGVNYYTPDGQSMQRAFLSTPVDYIKISSPFDTHRKHPILNRIRAHKGIDYAARIGTPVKTTGDGLVTFCGRKGAYGQVVVIQHNDRYETLYAHLSNFKKGLATGDHVKQGDVIGYVGQTGLATGPHLHYEFHVDGIYRNPETVKIPHSMPISNALLTDFKAQTLPFLAQLTQVKAQSLLAKTPPAITPGISVPSVSMQSSHYD